MNASNRDALSAVVARRRGRARLRSAPLAVGAASLVAAGAVAYTLPGGLTHAPTSTSAVGTAATAGSATTVHATSGGSAVAATANGSSGTVSAPAPASRSGPSHATSGGS
jgi:hypothetical protein